MHTKLTIMFFAVLASSCGRTQVTNQNWSCTGAWIPSVDSSDALEELIILDSTKVLMNFDGRLFGSNAYYESTSDYGMTASIQADGANRFRMRLRTGQGAGSTRTTLVLTLISADSMSVHIDSTNANEAISMVRDRNNRTSARVLEVRDAVKRIYEILNDEINLFDESSVSKLPVYGDAVETSLGIGMLKAAMLDRRVETDGIVAVSELTDNSCTASFKIDLTSDTKSKQERGVKAHMKITNGQWRMKFSDLLGDKMD